MTRPSRRVATQRRTANPPAILTAPFPNPSLLRRAPLAFIRPASPALIRTTVLIQCSFVCSQVGRANSERVLDSYESPLIAKLSWESRSMRLRVALKKDFGLVVDVRFVAHSEVLLAFRRV